MPVVDFKQSFFELFNLPEQFSVDLAVLHARFLAVQQASHPDRFSAHSAREQRVAVQYSSFINEAYTTLKQPLSRAVYLLARAGMSRESVTATAVDGGFLIQQMELREKLESIAELVDPETVLEHLQDEIGADMAELEARVATTLHARDYDACAGAVVKMQYLDKLRNEAEQLEAQLLD